MADLKSNCNTVYLDLVAMIEAINKGFPLLVRQSPSTSPCRRPHCAALGERVLRAFLFIIYHLTSFMHNWALLEDGTFSATSSVEFFSLSSTLFL